MQAQAAMENHESLSDFKHPRLRELVEYLASARNEVETALIGVDDDVSMMPVEGRGGRQGWSLSQIADHLARIEKRWLLGVQRAISQVGLDYFGNEVETSSLLNDLERFDIENRTRFMEAPSFSAPEPNTPLSSVLPQLRQARLDLVNYLQKLDGLALTKLTMPHPSYGDLNLYDWIIFLAKHERRHAAQMREVRERLGNV